MTPFTEEPVHEGWPIVKTLPKVGRIQFTPDSFASPPIGVSVTLTMGGATLLSGKSYPKSTQLKPRRPKIIWWKQGDTLELYPRTSEKGEAILVPLYKTPPYLSGVAGAAADNHG